MRKQNLFFRTLIIVVGIFCIYVGGIDQKVSRKNDLKITPNTITTWTGDQIVVQQIIDLHNGYEGIRCPKGYTLHGEDFLCHTHVWDDKLNLGY